MPKMQQRKKIMEQLLESTSFSIDVFNAWLHYTNDFDDFCKIANSFNAEIGNENVSGKCIWIQNEQGISKFLIGCFNGCDSTLAHECTHAAFYISKG